MRSQIRKRRIFSSQPKLSLNGNKKVFNMDVMYSLLNKIDRVKLQDKNTAIQLSVALINFNLNLKDKAIFLMDKNLDNFVKRIVMEELVDL